MQQVKTRSTSRESFVTAKEQLIAVMNFMDLEKKSIDVINKRGGH
jgi:hypothetical protein